jgi:lipopolysaccharide transport system permease protein
MVRTIKTYEPDNSLKEGYFSILGHILAEFRANKWLMQQLFKREFYATYKQSFAGILWAFILPLASVGAFLVMNSSGIFNIGTIGVPYPLYAVLGMAFWQIFSLGLIASSNSLVNAGSMITKINFSKKSLVISSMGPAVISFIIQFTLVCILFAYYGFMPSMWILLLPFLIMPLILLTLGLGLMLSLLNGISRDIGNMLSIIITFLLFLTPVLYAKPKIGMLAELTAYNPVYYLISTPRELILMGTGYELSGFIFSSILSITVFLVCLVVFHLTETRVAERV